MELLRQSRKVTTMSKGEVLARICETSHDNWMFVPRAMHIAMQSGAHIEPVSKELVVVRVAVCKAISKQPAFTQLASCQEYPQA